MTNESEKKGKKSPTKKSSKTKTTDAKSQAKNSTGKKTRVALAAESNDFVFAVCERFFEQMAPAADGSKKKSGAAAAVAEWIKEKYGRTDVNREKIYPLVWEAFQRKYLLMSPPIDKTLRDGLIERYRLNEDGGRFDVEVVNVAGPTASKHVGSVAADRIIQLIYAVAAEKRERAVADGENPENVRVHLGFGAGYAAMEVARRLSERVDVQTPKLTLHAISPGGFYVAEQQKDPTTYFNYFVDKGVDVKCVGFFSPPVVRNEDYGRLKRNPSLRRCFERRDEIDILVTSLASEADEHGLFRQYFEYLQRENLLEEDALTELRRENWVGDVLFQPYSADRPLSTKGVRAVALFDFNELVEFSRRPGKRVVVVGAPCGKCGALKAEALRPLLANESLRLWTSLIVDRQTAQELLPNPDKTTVDA